jgi:scyllo-inositol 2-dehydrogenase (NADP+)
LHFAVTIKALKGIHRPPVKEENMVRVGLLGFGLAGRVFHAPTIRAVPGMELACILERHGSGAQENYPQVRVARTLEELLSDETIQLCVIGTPHHTHFDLAGRCLLAGRDVVVDKPFTVTLQESEELIALARKKKRFLTVYQNRRWDGDFLTVKKILDSGTLGRVVEYEVRFERFRPELRPNNWRERDDPGSGMLLELGPHLVDQALMLFGTPQAITGQTFRQREGSQVDDAFDVCLEYPEIRASLRARIIAYSPGPHFAVHGTKGSFVKYGMDPQEEALKAGALPEGENWGEDSQENWGTLRLVGQESQRVETEHGDYRCFYANVRDVIEKGIPPAVTAEQAWRTMRVLDLAQQSSRERRTLAWDEAPAC